MKLYISLNTKHTEPAPKGWRRHVGDDELNPHGIKPYHSIFIFNAARRSNGPLYNLTIVTDGDTYQAAHGGIVMPEKYKTAKQAGAAAMEWFEENAEA